MIQRDFIMRQIQQLVQVLAQVIFLKSINQYEEAREVIQTAIEGVFGQNTVALIKLSDTELLSLCETQDGLNAEFALALADLLYEESLLNHDEETALDAGRRALFLYEKVVTLQKVLPLQAVDKMAALNDLFNHTNNSKE